MTKQTFELLESTPKKNINPAYSEVFNLALGWIFPAEGGYVDDISDPGGATKYGISLRLLKSMALDINQDGRIDALDVRLLDIELASDIYHEEFWQRCRCDELPERVALVLFDAAVNSGVRRAIKQLQRACRVKADGLFGPKTLAAAHRMDTNTLMLRILVIRARYYHRITLKNPVFKRFINGWYSRLFKLQQYTLEHIDV